MIAKRCVFTTTVLATTVLLASGVTGAMAQDKGSAKMEAPTPVPATSLDGSFIKPYDNVWRFSVKLPDGTTKFQGLWTDHVETTAVDGKPALARVQGMTYFNGLTSSVVNVFDPKTMAPITSATRRPSGITIKREFKGAHVTSHRVPAPGAKEETVELDLPAPVYDFYGGMYGMLLVALPLKEGYSGTLPALDEDTDKPVAAKFVVKGKEMVYAGSKGTVEAWVVESAGDKNTMTFWLTKAAPHIIKLQMTFPDNKNVATWDMIF